MVQGNIIREVQKAIFESEIPIFLYMIELAAANATNGKPMANQVLGIQKMGDLCAVFVVGKIVSF